MELRGEAVLGRAAAASAVARFCRGIVDAVAPYVVAVKPQSAFFEVLGPDGMRALEEVCDYARSVGLLVLLDAKRGDIGSTARAYAAAYLEPRESGTPLADAMTASPYLGHRLRRAVPRRVSPPRQRDLLPRPHLERGRERTSRTWLSPTDARSGSTSPPSSTSGASHSSASTGSPASARSSAPRTRVASRRRVG